jgi:uncharacterized protein
VIQHLSIPRDGLTLAADLHVPDDLPDGLSGLDPARPLPAVVLSTPGSSVKEQIGATYGSRLATHGLAALVFDPAHQGRSGGEPRDLEDPYRRAEDISYAIDALGVMPEVDPGRIGVLGICAGGGYAVHTARTDHRIKAVGTVVATDIGEAFRGFQAEGPAAALDVLAHERSLEVRAGSSDRRAWLPETLEQAARDGVTDRDTLEAIRYYRTDRGWHAGSTNRRLTRSDALILGFDAFHLVDRLLTQPLQVVLAGRRGSTPQHDHGTRLWEMAPNAVDLMVVDGAGHYEMYDVPEYVDAAVERLADFYGRSL